MDRRVAGAVLLVLVVLAALIVPDVVGRRVVGSAARLPVPQPPAVGQCFGSLSEPSGNDPEDPYSLPTQHIDPTPCSGQVVGEIVSVMTAPDQSSPRNRPSRACGSAIAGYAGLQVGQNGRAELPGAPRRPMFQLLFPVKAVFVEPSPVQQVLGASWTACAVTPVLGNGYHGTLRNALTSGVLPGEYSLCRTTVDQFADAVACVVPHRVEVIGSTEILDLPTRPSAAAIDAGCVELAATLLRRDDPTLGGALIVDGVSNDFSVLRGACILDTVGDRMLTGTLIGLGDGPVPWVG